MGIITISEAKEILEPVLPVLSECVEVGWENYQTTLGPHVPLAWSGFRAHGVHELVLEQVRLRMSGLPGVDVRERTARRRFLVYYRKRITLQFKKLRRDFQTANYPTKTAKAFNRQQPDLLDCKPYPRITVGYQLSGFATSLSGTYLTHLYAKSYLWWLDLNTGEESIQFDFPTPDQLPPHKESDASDEGEEGEGEDTGTL